MRWMWLAILVACDAERIEIVFTGETPANVPSSARAGFTLYGDDMWIDDDVGTSLLTVDERFRRFPWRQTITLPADAADRLVTGPTEPERVQFYIADEGVDLDDDGTACAGDFTRNWLVSPFELFQAGEVTTITIELEEISRLSCDPAS